MMVKRSMFVALATILLGSLAAAPGAWAQEFPSKPIRIVLPYVGGTDFVARWLAGKLPASLGQQIIVDPRLGASGNIGHDYVKRAAPDGYTLMLGAPPWVVNPYLFLNSGYTVERDFTPIALVATLPNMLVVHPSVPAKTLRELVQLARSNPGKLNYGAGPSGTTGHLAGELFKSVAKINIVSVPYKGASFALVGALGGEVDVVIPSVSSVEAFVKDKRMRALAVLDTKRVESMPDVPTTAEAGMPEFLIVNWYVLAGPAGLPRAIVDRMNAEVNKVMQMADTRKQFMNIGGEPVVSTPEQAAKFLREDSQRWGKVIRDAKIKAE